MNPLDRSIIDKLKLRIAELEEAFTMLDRDECSIEDANLARLTVYGDWRNGLEQSATEMATPGENISGEDQG